MAAMLENNAKNKNVATNIFINRLNHMNATSAAAAAAPEYAEVDGLVSSSGKSEGGGGRLQLSTEQGPYATTTTLLNLDPERLCVRP